jgi:sec-independent protein translocase protein TatA
MPFGNLRPLEIIIILLIVLLLFGAKRLPVLAKSVGQSLRIFKKETTSAGTEPEADGAGAPAAGTAQARAQDSDPEADS